MKMKKAYKVFAVFVALIFLITPFKNEVHAAQKHWAEKEINYVMSKGIMVGNGKGVFRSDDEITRAELMTTLNNVFKYEQKAEIDYYDVKKHKWYYEEVQKAVGAGYISGCGSKTMKPERYVTRQEAAKMIALAYDLPRKGTSSIKFKDAKNIDNWAIEYVKAVVENGFMQGLPGKIFGPTKKITRAEVATIIYNADHGSVEEPVIKDDEWFVVQTGAYSDKNNALEEVEKLRDAGFKNAFMSAGPKNYYHVYANKFKEKAKAEQFMNQVRNKGFDDVFVPEELRKVEDDVRPEKPIEKPIEKPQKPQQPQKVREFIELVDELSKPQEINEILVKDKVNSERARALYNCMNNEEKTKINKKYIDKLVAVEKKIKSLKTPIMGKTKTTVEQAQEWARSKGADQRFIDIAPVFWEYGELTGICPEVAYCQAAKETAFGNYTGAVKPEMNNWAGIKTREAAGDRTEDHETFATPEDGVRGHYNHLGIYCGVEPIGEPHSRWYSTSTAGWAGTVKYVEDLGGKWAPSSRYGISIVEGFMEQLYNTPMP